jgi:predicted RNA-binding Zn-ribbon protein involved in translation (DUF1610 family)
MISLQVESIESDFRCSICGSKIGIRNRCSHKIGEIYNGEMCGRIVNKIEIKGISIVRNPFDKYTILEAQGVSYNYALLETLMKYLDNPFEKWGYDIEYMDWDYKKDLRYKNVNRNDMCPCGSGKKFKKCCLINHEKTKHYKIYGDNENFFKNPLPYNEFCTKLLKH